MAKKQITFFCKDKWVNFRNKSYKNIGNDGFKAREKKIMIALRHKRKIKQTLKKAGQEYF